MYAAEAGGLRAGTAIVTASAHNAFLELFGDELEELDGLDAPTDRPEQRRPARVMVPGGDRDDDRKKSRLPV